MVDNPQQPPRQNRDTRNLVELLEENRQFLHRSNRDYDLGNPAEAKRLAVVLRTLLRDYRNRSISLMEQLGLKDIPWVDSTAGTNNPELKSWPGLVAMTVDRAKSSAFEPLFQAQKHKELAAVVIDFDDWWNQPAIRDDQGENHSRWNLIAWFANKEGGAHVDPKLVTEYERIKTRGLGYEVRIGNESYGNFGDAVPAAIRQIAHEVEISLTLNKHPHLENWGVTDGDKYFGVQLL